MDYFCGNFCNFAFKVCSKLALFFSLIAIWIEMGGIFEIYTPKKPHIKVWETAKESNDYRFPKQVASEAHGHNLDTNY